MNDKQKPKLERKYVQIRYVVIFLGIMLISSLLIDYVFYPSDKNVRVESPQNIYYQGMLLFSVIVGSAMIGYSW